LTGEEPKVGVMLEKPINTGFHRPL
jgi:hypothetical protein